MRVFKIIILCLLPLCSFPQNDSVPGGYRPFFTAWLQNSDQLTNFVQPQELALSGRLGTMYKGVQHKFMISNDLNDDVKQQMLAGEIPYTCSIETLGNGFDCLLLDLPQQQQLRFYFQYSLLISRPAYYAKDWEQFESKFFVFHVSDACLYNTYAAERLDAFVRQIADLMVFSESDIERLQRKKIHYFLCKDDKKIEQLTGYVSRGQFYIPYDYVISTFNCHYHELIHLLINYRLGELPLYTQPFLQEGLAVALGGRGGKEPGVILNLGHFVMNSGFLDYKTLLSRNGFYSMDASMSYPASGLYTRFLIDTLGFDAYEQLYEKYSGSIESVEKNSINSADLPADALWQQYLAKFGDKDVLPATGNTENMIGFITSDEYTVAQNRDWYLFVTQKDLFVNSQIRYPDYDSKLFKEMFPNRAYNSEKYAIRVSESEISVYNLFTNNLIAKYASGFSKDMKPVPVDEHGAFRFLVRKAIFDEGLDVKSIKVVE